MCEQIMMRLSCLTERERDVWTQIGEGASQAQLAQALGIAAKTAAAHTRQVMRKLRVATFPELARLATTHRADTAAARPGQAVHAVVNMVDPAVWVNVFDAHPDPLMYISCDYKVLRVNLAQAQLLGRRTSSCEGSTCYELIHGTDAPPEDCPCATVMREKTAKTCNIHFSAIDGIYRLTVSPILHPDGSVAGLLHAARSLDICDGLALPTCTSSRSSLTARRAGGHTEKAGRHLFDRLLAFVLHHVGRHASDTRLRSSMLNNFIELLSEFDLGHISLWQMGEESARAVFRHTFTETQPPSASACPSPSSALFREAKRVGFALATTDGHVKCLAAMSDAIAGSATYLMMVTCPKGSSGCAYLQPEPMRFMCNVLGEIVRHATADDDVLADRGLTPRETAVMRLLEGDYLYKTIADLLGVSLHTVHVHLRNIYRKLGVHTRADAVRKWRTHRWNCCRAHSSVQPHAKPKRPR